MSARFAVIVNAASGSRSTQHKLRQLRRVFALHNAQPEFFLAHGSGALLSAVQKALTQGWETVVAAGGDGTVSTVAAEVVRAKAVLGLLPLGTLNHLAKDLKIPQDLDKAVEVLVAGHTVAIDVGEVNGRIFVNNSSIGLYPKLVRLRKKHEGWGRSRGAALLAAAIGVLRGYSFYEVRLEIAGQDTMLRTPFVFVGNNEYEIEGARFGARQQIDRQQLTLLVLRHSSRLGLLPIVWRLLFGGLRQARDFDVYIVDRARIDAKKKFLPVSLDGEVITLPTPLEYTLAPRALKVIVP
jgi:diacylglycerol kinase family enzyme